MRYGILFGIFAAVFVNTNGARINIGENCPSEEQVFEFEEGKEYARFEPKARLQELRANFKNATNHIYGVTDAIVRLAQTRYYEDRVVYVYKLSSTTARNSPQQLKPGKCFVTIRITPPKCGMPTMFNGSYVVSYVGTADNPVNPEILNTEEQRDFILGSLVSVDCNYEEGYIQTEVSGEADSTASTYRCSTVTSNGLFSRDWERIDGNEFMCRLPLGSDYIECTPGDLNVILSSPHGGYEEPDSIQDRDYGCYIDGECVWNHDCGVKDPDECDAVTTRDAYTQELTRLIAENLYDLTGKTPTMAINLLYRGKLDANREINEATFGEEVAVEAWEEYHRCINASKLAIEADESVHGKGLFLDIHGHGHPNVWAELGYLISGSRLDSDDFEPDDTSIYDLSTSDNVGAEDFETLFRGDLSFGQFLEDWGYESVPSPTNPGPDGADYFSGGYNTKIHGSRDGGGIDAIQIESARDNRELPERTNYAMAIANATVRYLTTHYGISFP